LALYGAVEAGGSKFICAVGTGPTEVREEARIATTTPAETLRAVVEFFKGAESRVGALQSFGIGSFGPLGLDPGSPDHGRVLKTPKPGWSDADLIGPLQRQFRKPVTIDTDVNAAALAEYELGAGRGTRALAYVTVGTGIGGGFIIDGQPLHGLMHPEVGHIRIQRDARDAGFAGICPFHGDCLEGLASGPAILARWHAPLSELGGAHTGLDIIGGYLGQLAANIALMHSCERAIFGGGVMQSAGLLQLVRRSTQQLLNGYLPHARFNSDLSEYITAPALGDRSGIAGAMLLAMHPVGPPTNSR
jgi:fructokinase